MHLFVRGDFYHDIWEKLKRDEAYWKDFTSYRWATSLIGGGIYLYLMSLVCESVSR